MLSITKLCAQVPSANMTINCPANATTGSDFIVTANYNYSNLVDGNIVVVVNYNDAIVSYQSSGGNVIPVITGSIGGIRTLTYTFPINSVGNDTSFIQMYFRYNCPNTCYGTTLTSEFSGNITVNGLPIITANPCTTSTQIENTWIGQHILWFYNCVNNRVTFRVRISGSTCFKIENASLTINPTISGATLYSSTVGTISGNTINLPNYSPNGTYDIFYTIQLPCETTYPDELTSSLMFNGNNCGNLENNIISIDSVIFQIPEYSSIAASFTQNTYFGYNLVQVGNNSGTPIDVNLITTFPQVKITSIDLANPIPSGTTVVMRLYDCNNTLIGTYNTFPIILNSSTLLSRAEYSYTNIGYNEYNLFKFYYNKTDSCLLGQNTESCVTFKTEGNYISNLTGSFCNCTASDEENFITQLDNYCVEPEINCISASNYNDECYMPEEIIPICYEFYNTGYADLLNGSLTYTLPSSVDYIGGLTVNGVPTTGTFIGNVLTIPLPMVPFSNQPIQTVCFDTKVKSTAVYGAYESTISIQ